MPHWLTILAEGTKNAANWRAEKSPHGVHGVRHSDEYKYLSLFLRLTGAKTSVAEYMDVTLPDDSTDSRTLQKLDKEAFNGAGISMEEGFSEKNIDRAVAIFESGIAKCIKEMDPDDIPSFFMAVAAVDETKIIPQGGYYKKYDAFVGALPRKTIGECVYTPLCHHHEFCCMAHVDKYLYTGKMNRLAQ